MDIDTLQGLRRCPLFNGLTESEIIDLMHTVRYRVVRCCKGEFHAIEGSVCQYADIIIQGEMVDVLSGWQFISRGNFLPQPFSLL